MTEQETEAVLHGILRVVVGGEQRELPKLKLRPGRDWRRRAMASFGPLANLELDPAALVDSIGQIDEAEDVVLGLIAEYDATSALGGREALEDVLWPNEVGPLFQAMLAATLPFDQPDHQLPASVLEAVRSGSTTSTNGRSRAGGSIRTRSASGSTPAS
jgi:hypothetical protein